MNTMNKPVDLIRSIVNSNEKPQVLFCTVDKVNGSTCDVTPVSKNLATIKRVRLNTNSMGAGWRITPKVGSVVIVARLSQLNDAYVAMVSEVEKAEMAATDTIVFNGGVNGGIVKIKELEENLKALKEYVEAVHNALPTAFNAISSGSSANGLSGATSYSKDMAGKTIDFKNIENEKIKH